MSSDQPLTSTSATIAAAHYWAWAAAMRTGRDTRQLNLAKEAADALCEFWNDNGRHLPPAMGAREEFFFDLGSAARALFAVQKVTGADLYSDVATQMATRMLMFASVGGPAIAASDGRNGQAAPFRFTAVRGSETLTGSARQSWRQQTGPHLRKPALTFRITNRQLYDLIDLMMMDVPMEPVAPAAAEKKAAAAVAADYQADVAAYCYPHACSAEALLLMPYAKARAAAAIDSLGQRLASSPVLYTDAFAQWCRLRLLNGERDRFPLMDLDRLFAAQHPDGGFRTFMEHPDASRREEFSTTATIIALQTLAIYSDRSGRAMLPGPLTRRELAIV